MKLKQVDSWKQASQAIGAHVFIAPDIDEAKRQMKQAHPDIVPHTCYWHTNRCKTGEAWNSYYFIWMQND